MKVRKKTESHWVNTFLMRKWFGVRACWVERFAVSLIVTARRQIFTYKLKYHLNLISHDKNPILQTFRKIKTLRYTIWSITAIAILRMIFAKCRYIANEEKNQWIGPFHVETFSGVKSSGHVISAALGGTSKGVFSFSNPSQYTV